jgi:hypothetical protein
VFLIDDLLIGGIRFVLDKVATVVDQELNDEDRLRERLLNAQLSNDLGELSDEEFRAVEEDVLARLREIREAKGTGSGFVVGDDVRVSGTEVTFGGDDPDETRNRS